MLRLTRVRNGGRGLDLVKKLLVTPPNATSEGYAQGIGQLLDQAPRETFLMLLWDVVGDDKEPSVKGFILAFSPLGVDYVSLLQSYPIDSHPALVESFDLWVESVHRMKVRYEQFEGVKDVPSFLRFKVISHVLEHTIVRDVEGTHELPEVEEQKQEVKNDGNSNETDAKQVA